MEIFTLHTELGLLLGALGIVITIIVAIYASKTSTKQMCNYISLEGKETREALEKLQQKLQSDSAMVLEQLSQRLSALSAGVSRRRRSL